jgi:hypothetical protein
MYFPLRGSQTTIWLLGSKHLGEILVKWLEGSWEKDNGFKKGESERGIRRHTAKSTPAS